MNVTLGELIESGRTAIKEGVVGSLMIVAKDVGGESIPRGNTFVARFKNQKQADKFLATARMEYPGIDKKFRTHKTRGGGVEMSLSSGDAKKFESY